jgi:two-component system, OmpR family, phosphate regulon sensor histidine kinase PhoR
MSSLLKLRLALSLFFLALAVPAAGLIYQAYLRLQWETFHQHQSLAEAFAGQVDQSLTELMRVEDARSFTEYNFFNVVAPINSNLLQRSPLAVYPPPASVPGLIGHFQVDSNGQFSTPFVAPADTDGVNTGIEPQERERRQALATRMQDILAANRLLSAQARKPPRHSGAAVSPVVREAQALSERDDRQRSPAVPAAAALDAAPAQMDFDSLNESAASGVSSASQRAVNTLGRVDDLKLEQRFQGKAVIAEAEKKDQVEAGAKSKRALRKEANVLYDLSPSGATETSADAYRRTNTALRIRTFESEVDGFEASLLDSGELVMFRKVWRDGQRIVQGLIIDRAGFFAALATAPFDASALAHSSALVVARRGEVLARDAGMSSIAYDAASQMRGTLLYQSRLSAPFSDFELIFSVTRLPAGPGAVVIAWLAAVLALVLCGGTLLMYRLGARQLALARQQQEFIAAVSHELKTPLTSIRMYGEMLREGWAPEAKRQEYYSFIHDEAERLTRLINNVLNLARMTRNELKVELRSASAAQLVDLLHSKLGSVVSHAGRRYEVNMEAGLAERMVMVDLDCFTQVFLNLIDNALKFTNGEQALQINVRSDAQRGIEFAVRDFGPGIPRDQLERIFALFYRGENALTRATAGTGIGLALVKRLVEVMHGRIVVVNQQPGAEFRVFLMPAARA